MTTGRERRQEDVWGVVHCGAASRRQCAVQQKLQTHSACEQTRPMTTAPAKSTQSSQACGQLNLSAFGVAVHTRNFKSLYSGRAQRLAYAVGVARD